MKTITKVLSMVLVAVMLVGMFSVVASAAPATSGTLTITNASIGETYSIYKLFDAVLSDKQDGPVVYTGEIPASLTAYFKKNADGTITAVQPQALSAQAITDLIAYVGDANLTPYDTKVADTENLVFDNLPFGYYIVKSSLGASVSVDTTNPNAVIKDKNSGTWEIRKSVDDVNVSIGDTVTYELAVRTALWFGEKKVTRYEILDTLPSFLTDVTLTEIVIQKDGTEYYKANETELAAFQTSLDTSKSVNLPWVDANGDHMYPNKAVIFVRYTAKVTADAIIDGTGNANEMTARVYVDNEETHYEEKKDDSVIYTYGTAVKKTDDKGNTLTGAIFVANGLTVKEKVEGVPGLYQVISYDPTSTEKGTEMEVDKNGIIVIEGLCSDNPLTFTEVKAPNGYNLLNSPVVVGVFVTGVKYETSYQKIWYDADGNILDTEEGATDSGYVVINYPDALKESALKTNTIINKAGTEMPETGGEGTTMFILIGSMVALMSAVVLVARKKTAGYR